LSSAGWRKTAASCSTRSGGESRQRQPREFKAPASSKEGIQNGSDDESRNLEAARRAGRLLVLLGDWEPDTCSANSDGGWLTEIGRLVQLSGASKADIYEKAGDEIMASARGCEIFRPKPKKVRDVFDEAALAIRHDLRHLMAHGHCHYEISQRLYDRFREARPSSVTLFDPKHPATRKRPLRVVGIEPAGKAPDNMLELIRWLNTPEGRVFTGWYSFDEWRGTKELVAWRGGKKPDVHQRGTGQ
jgi:hypothetical protein